MRIYVDDNSYNRKTEKLWKCRIYAVFPTWKHSRTLFRTFSSVTSKMRSSDRSFVRVKLFYTPTCCNQNISGTRLLALWYSLPASRSQCIIIERKTTQIVTNYCLVFCLCVYTTQAHMHACMITRANIHIHTCKCTHMTINQHLCDIPINVSFFFLWTPSSRHACTYHNVHVYHTTHNLPKSLDLLTPGIEIKKNTSL